MKEIIKFFNIVGVFLASLYGMEENKCWTPKHRDIPVTVGVSEDARVDCKITFHLSQGSVIAFSSERLFHDYTYSRVQSMLPSLFDELDHDDKPFFTQDLNALISHPILVKIICDVYFLNTAQKLQTDMREIRVDSKEGALLVLNAITEHFKRPNND